MHKNISAWLAIGLRFALITGILLINTLLYGQNKPEMADVMRSNGKIYVVVAVCLTILIGLFFYAYVIDRKIKKLENKD